VLTVAPAQISLAWSIRPEEGSIELVAMREAVETWNRVLRGKAAFVWAEDETTADVLVSASETLGDGSRSFAGLTRWRRSVKSDIGRLTGELALALRARGGRRLAHSEMLHAALHELGHLLGLDDSSDPNSVMAPLGLGLPRSEPSLEDTRAVLRLRSEAEALLSL
jgi:predicted Zn-dependent protease